MKRLALALVACLAVGCRPDTCASTDLECMIDHLSIQQDGKDVPTAKVAGATMMRLKRAGGGGGGSGGGGGGVPVTPGNVSIGCFIDEDPMHDLTGRSMSMANLSVESCASYCTGYTAFAVEDRTWCYCGNDYGRYGAAPITDCYMSCPGNASERCGGFLRENVYTFGSSSGGGGDMGSFAGADMRVAGGGGGGGAGIGGGGGGGPQPGAGAPTITMSPMTKIVFTKADDPHPLALPFTDPNGCTPSFCFSYCNPKVRCSSHSTCTHSGRDGFISGVWRSAMNPRYEPGDERVWNGEVHVTPASAPNWQDVVDLATQIEQGLINPIDISIDVGVDVSVAVEVQSSTMSSSGGGGGSGGIGTYCSGFQAYCHSCTINSCCNSAGCWYDLNDGSRFNCAAQNDCTGAAQAASNHCRCGQP